MNVAILFKNIRDIQGELAALELRKDYIRESMLPKAIQYDKDNVSASPADPMSKFVDKLSDLEELTQKRYNKLVNDNILAEEILSKMPTSKYRMLLQLRYLQGGIKYRYSWSEVAINMGYDECYVKKELHQKALCEAQEIYNKILKSEKTPKNPH